MTDEIEIIFSEERHEYTVDGIVRPSVTRILGDLGFTDFSAIPADRLQAARIRGTDAHHGVYCVEDDIRYYDELDSAILPFVDAYLAMKEDTGWIPTHREKIVFDSTLNVAGMVDGVGPMTRLGYEEAVIDYKTGVKQNATRYQTAGYAAALKKPFLPRFSVQLKNTGKYQLVPHIDRTDVFAWRSIVATYHLKHNGK